MNTARKCLLLALVCLPAACAGTSETRVAAAPASELDEAYVSAVERMANDRGVRVVWVNPPRKRSDD